MRIEVTCSNCGRKFWMEDYESKPCPGCGKVAVGPKASSGGCFITEACIKGVGLPDNCLELNVLRHFRDEYLAKNEEGKKMIEEYYKTAPAIVDEINKNENSKEIFKEIFEDIREIVLMIEKGEQASAIEGYKKLFLKLKQEYLSSN